MSYSTETEFLVQKCSMQSSRVSLEQHPLFTGVSSSEIVKLLSYCHPFEFEKGHTLIRQGEAARRVALVNEGRAEVCTESRAGMRVTVRFHEAPFLVGATELWDTTDYLASVVALEPGSGAYISKPDFLSLLHANHQVSINVLRLVTRVFFLDCRDRRVQYFGRLENYLANVLCSYGELYGEQHSYGVLLQKEVSKTELAATMGVARRSVIRAFDVLEKEGLIQLREGQLIIPDLVSLRRKAHAPFE